jgi:hypothetical protein
MADVRKLAVLLLVIGSSFVAAATASVSPGPARTNVAGAMSIRVPAGWHLVRGWLSDVMDPIPRLAVASFPVKLSRRTCVCGMPNVRDFPRTGAFLFIWEYPHLPQRTLERFPRRLARFRMTSEIPQRFVCQGPSDEIIFQQAGRAFQAEIYVGSAAGPKVRARLLSAIDSLRTGRDRASVTEDTAPNDRRSLIPINPGRHRSAPGL